MKLTRLFSLMPTLAVFLLAGPTSAEILFEDDFETGDFASEASNRWAWRQGPTRSDVDTTMMRGQGDVYSVSRNRVYRGDYALRLDFDGRNSFCDSCGTTPVTLNSTTASTGCFSASIDGPYGPSVFNKSNGFTEWEVSSVSGRQICVDTDNVSGDSIFPDTRPELNAGDEIRVPRRCGVNGNIGGNPTRRSDCNRAINYLRNVNASDIGLGESLSRRFYAFIPSQTVMPNTTFKLGYIFWRRADGSTGSGEFNLSVQRNLQIVSKPGSGEIVTSRSSAGEDAWYYFEETWTRESAPGRRDGSYRAYMGRADADVAELTTPFITRNGIEVGEINRISMNGNWQHTTDVSGYVYFDDIVMATEYVGPIGFDPNSLPARPIDDLN